MNILPFLGHKIIPFSLQKHLVIQAESNVSIMARLSWKYRVQPSRFISSIVLRSKSSHGVGLERDVAAHCNSVTKKSKVVTKRLEALTELNLSGSSSYSYLQNILDKGAHGLISGYKKWCADCYSETQNLPNREGYGAIADELYWSLSHSKYCARHLCTLSDCCAKCYQFQPYISNRYEPGFCHSCGFSLAKAPSVRFGLDQISAQQAMKHLDSIDIFLPHMVHDKNYKLKLFARNIRALAQTVGDDGFEVLAECFGISALTLKDWCVAKHGVSLESLLKIVEGLQLQKMSILFTDIDTLLESVQPLTKQFNFNIRKNMRSRLPEISKCLHDMATGKKLPQPRATIAKEFGVSVGMLEHAFRTELTHISGLLARSAKERREKTKNTLQHKMNVAVQRCCSKGRPWDWQHIFAELKDVDFRNVSQRELDTARDLALRKYKSGAQRATIE